MDWLESRLTACVHLGDSPKPGASFAVLPWAGSSHGKSCSPRWASALTQNCHSTFDSGFSPAILLTHHIDMDELVGSFEGMSVMVRSLFAVGFSILALSGCVPDEPTSFAAPSGELAHTVRCTADSGQCMSKAAATCSGPYQVLDSYSNAGGLVADIIPGPVTWYTMSFSCGASDGRMPSFPFRGGQMVMPSIPARSVPTTQRTNCIGYGNSVSCTSTSY
jgi:hypothetical protein